MHRVYLIGGAAATGTPEDTVVVYTPAILDEGIYMANLTLPPGYFWSDVIEPPGELSQRSKPAASQCRSTYGSCMCIPLEPSLGGTTCNYM